MNDALEYDRRAQQHRPTDPAAIAAEIMRMHRDGLRARDIAQALNLNDHEVVQIIAREVL